MQQWMVSKARRHNCYRLSGRSESPDPTVETMTEDMSRARAVSVPGAGLTAFNASGSALDGRGVSPAPSESFMSTPPPPPPSPEHHHAQAEDLLPDPHVSVDIEEASAASELAANLNTGSSRSLDGDHGDEEVHPVATASNNDDDLDFIFGVFSTAVQEYNKCTAILKQCEEETNAFQASTDSIRAFWRQKKAEMVAEVADVMDPALKELERDLNAFQAKIDMRKASVVEAARRANAFMDRWTKFAADGTIE